MTTVILFLFAVTATTNSTQENTNTTLNDWKQNASYPLCSSLYDARKEESENIPINDLKLATAHSRSEYDDIIAMIVDLSEEYGVDTATSLRIAKCESGYSSLAKNPNSSASGVYQITYFTFLDGIKRRKLDWIPGDVFNAYKNIDMAMWFIARGEISRWNASKYCWDI